MSYGITSKYHTFHIVHSVLTWNIDSVDTETYISKQNWSILHYNRFDISLQLIQFFITIYSMYGQTYWLLESTRFAGVTSGWALQTLVLWTKQQVKQLARASKQNKTTRSNSRPTQRNKWTLVVCVSCEIVRTNVVT